MQPCFCHFQIAMDGGFGNPERGSNFRVGQAAEKQQLDDLSFSGIKRFEALESFVQFGETRQWSGADDDCFVERNALRAAASFLTFSGPGVVDQNMAHHAGRDGVEVDAILPVSARIREPEIRFMDQGRRAGLRGCAPRVYEADRKPGGPSDRRRLYRLR
jgi:hypothetical protein